MVSNCSMSETGSINGQKGDQTGKEYKIIPWYSYGWDYVLRHPNLQIQKYITQNAIAAANNDNIGYGQADNRTFWQELEKVGYDASKITNKCNADCSSSSCSIAKAAGFLANDTALQSLVITTCRYMPANLTKVGFVAYQDTKYLKSKDYLQPGDILVNTSKHACIYVGSNPSTEANPLSAVSTGFSGSVAAMFSSSYEEGDAIVREFCSIDKSGNRTIGSGLLKLSVINYAPLVAGIAEANGLYLQAGLSGDVNVDTSNLSGNCKIVVDLLVAKGLNGAAACGIAGNIYHESGFRPDAVGDHGTSFGICQWHNTRGTSMKNFVGTNWKTNLSGQVDFLWHELTTSYTSVLNHLRSTPNTVEGCKSAADNFVRNFERPSGVDAASVKRQATAVEYFNQLIMIAISPNSVGGAGNLVSYSGSALSLINTVQVPQDIQTGLIKNYTNYTYFFKKWKWTQRKIADAWAAKGKTSSKGIATIDGHYLVAMSSKFGTTGDLVVVHLANGETFSAILADSKGSDATSSWGHVMGTGKVDIIEWEAIGSETSGSKGTNIQLGSWLNVKVTSVDNYGAWI